MRRSFSFLSLVAGLTLVEPSVRPTRFDDLPVALRSRVASSVFEFDALRDSIERETAIRETLGEHEHLIYYLLQSNSFTSRSAIDPRESARQAAAQEFKVNAFVRARIRDFVAALSQPTQDPRIAYWQSHLDAEQRTTAGLEATYRETMAVAVADPSVALLRRGHSTDTDVRVNFTMWNAFDALPKYLGQRMIENVLIVGPGQDFAPISGFRDDSLPQSYQPYLTADALLDLKIAEERFLRIQCVDINTRVLNILKEFKRAAQPKLLLPVEPGPPAYQRWFDRAGQSIGTSTQDASRRQISVRPSLANQVRGETLNIITERLVPSPDYDLIVVTNVLNYYRDSEILLGLLNLNAMLGPNGFLIHNNRSASIQGLANEAGFEELYSQAVGKDGFTILRRR